MQTINYENFETKIETYFNKRFFRQHIQAPREQFNL